MDVIGGSSQALHILGTKDRVTYVRCSMLHEPEAQRYGCMGSLTSTGDFIWCLYDAKTHVVQRSDDVKTGLRRTLELLRSCQLIHTEGSHLLYSAPCFLVDTIDTMIVWKEKVLPSRFNVVRALDDI